MRNVFLILLIFTSFCSSSNSKQQKENFTIKKGELVAQSQCSANPTQGYALYVPKNYDSSKIWPVVIFFDPRAKGLHPIQLYKSLDSHDIDLFIKELDNYIKDYILIK